MPVPYDLNVSALVEAVHCVVLSDRLLPSPSQPVADREDSRRAPSQVVTAFNCTLLTSISSTNNCSH